MKEMYDKLYKSNRCYTFDTNYLLETKDIINNTYKWLLFRDGVHELKIIDNDMITYYFQVIIDNKMYNIMLDLERDIINIADVEYKIEEKEMDTKINIDVIEYGLIPYKEYDGMKLISEDTLKEMYGDELKEVLKYAMGATMPIIDRVKNYYYDYDVYEWIDSYNKKLKNK